MNFLQRMYGLLLNLYPRDFLAEFRDELQTVFDLSLEEARQIGKVEIVQVILKELINLPGAILYEHLRARRKAKMIKKFDSRLDFPPGSRSELLAAFTPFFVVLILLNTNLLLVPYTPEEMPAWGETILVLSRLSLLGFVFVLLVLGVGKGLPRWFLPYLGFVFSIVSIFAFNFLLEPRWQGFSFRTPEMIRNFAYQGLLLMGILPLVVLLVLSAMFIPRFRPFYRRVRNDWTLLSFIIYGTAPFAILLSFDAYEKNSTSCFFGSLLILAIGGWSYLRSNVSWKKFLYLYIGMTLSMAVAAMGRAILCKNSLFDEWVSYCIWQNEMVDTMSLGIWLAVFMLLTFTINLLPPAKSDAPPTEPYTRLPAGTHPE